MASQPPSEMSTKQLIAELAQLDVPTKGLIEKSELVAALEKAKARRKRDRPDGGEEEEGGAPAAGESQHKFSPGDVVFVPPDAFGEHYAEEHEFQWLHGTLKQRAIGSFDSGTYAEEDGIWFVQYDDKTFFPTDEQFFRLDVAQQPTVAEVKEERSAPEPPQKKSRQDDADYGQDEDSSDDDDDSVEDEDDESYEEEDEDEDMEDDDDEVEDELPQTPQKAPKAAPKASKVETSQKAPAYDQRLKVGANVRKKFPGSEKVIYNGEVIKVEGKKFKVLWTDGMETGHMLKSATTIKMLDDYRDHNSAEAEAKAADKAKAKAAAEAKAEAEQREAEAPAAEAPADADAEAEWFDASPEPSSEACDDAASAEPPDAAASAEPPNQPDDAPPSASDECFAEDYEFCEGTGDVPFRYKDRFQKDRGLIFKDDKGQWRKVARAGLPKAEFLRYIGGRVYLNKTHYKEKDEIWEKGGEYDRQRKRWYVPFCVQWDKGLQTFSRVGLVGFWLPSQHRAWD